MRRSIVLTSLVVLVTLAAACGSGAAPTLSDLKLSSTTITRGQVATGSVTVADPDGLGGLKINMRFTGAATVPQQSVSVAGASDALTSAPLPFQFTLVQGAPTGSYTLFISATDGDENTSNELSAAIQVN